MEEDWGLQAIVRGLSCDQYTSIDYNYHHDELYYNFGVKNTDNSVIVNELDDLYKPFYDHQTIASLDSPENEVKFEKVLDQKETIVVAAATHATKYKRKNQQKRVVQVTAEGLSSDLWAWRKYGQKPIKGSPYPRSYYRCSSSKNCLARKQVEESCSNPGMFILTYTAEHNHSQPTRRSSLAGTNRRKFSALKTTETCVSDIVQALKHEKKDDEQDMISGDDYEFVIPDSILTDDF